MTPFSELNVGDDLFLNFDSPMFALVDPNDICPIEMITTSDPTPATKVHNIENEQFISKNFISSICDRQEPLHHHQQLVHQPPPQPPLQPLQQQQQPLQQQQLHQLPRQQEVHIELYQQQAAFVPHGHEIQQVNGRYQLVEHTMIEPPPNLPSHDSEPKLLIRQRLRLHRERSQRRQERLKARLDSKPLQLPMEVMRKGNSKKITGRERQLELERQEARQLQLRDHYLNLISQLERKCSKLREILENIVSTSPEYNAQMINYLESSELLYDRQETLTTDLLSDENDATIPLDNSDSNNENIENNSTYSYQE